CTIQAEQAKSSTNLAQGLICSLTRLSGARFDDLEHIAGIASECAAPCRNTEKSCGNISAETARLDFILDSRVALKPRYRDKVQVQQGQIGQRRKVRLKTDRGLCRVDANSQIVCRDLKDVVTHPTGIVRVVSECLGICEQQVLPV